MDIIDQLIQERDRLVKDYGRLTKVAMVDEVNAFPGASGFLDGEPGRRRVLILLHNYAGTGQHIAQGKLQERILVVRSIYTLRAQESNRATCC